MAAKKKPAGPQADRGMDWAQVKRVLELMKRNGLEEFEYADGDFRVRLKKLSAGGNPGAPSTNSGGTAQATASVAATQGPAAAAPAPEPEEKLHFVRSPIVGTYYAASSPTAPPFVKAGDRVKRGQVLCVIEAMKLMNEIEADADGEIARILVENAQPVEYGEGLFAIRPSEPDRPA